MNFIPQDAAREFLLQYKYNGLKLCKSANCDFYFLEVLDKPNTVRGWEITKFDANQLRVAIVNFIYKWTREQAIKFRESCSYVTKHDIDLVYQFVQVRLLSNNAVGAEDVFYNPEKKEDFWEKKLYNVYVGCLADISFVEKIEGDEDDDEDDEDLEEYDEDDKEANQ